MSEGSTVTVFCVSTRKASFRKCSTLVSYCRLFRESPVDRLQRRGVVMTVDSGPVRNGTQ